MNPDVKQFPERSVQRRLLIPLVCVLLLLVGGGAASLLVNQQRNMKYSSQKLLEGVSRSFEMSLKQDAKILTALEDSLLQGTHLHDALKTKDRNQLLDLYEITFQKFRKKYSVTHFYFHNPDKVNLLRVHKPEKHGDLIDRFTLHEAENSGKTAWGVELGPLGTFTLRVVQPVYTGDTLIGYLELGQEIEEELQRLQQSFNVELAMTINKDALEQLSWETGMDMLGRESNWNRYQKMVLIYYSQSSFPAEMDRFIRGEKEGRRYNLETEVQFDNKSWQLIAHPLKDASGSDVGNLFILRDISAIKTKFTQIAATTVSFALLLVGVILTFYYRILRRTDQVISNQQKYLRKSKAKFQGLVESSSGWSWEVNADGNYTYASPQVVDILGYKPEEVVGQAPFDMMPPEEADRVTEIFKELLEAAKPIVQLERVVLHKNGQHLVLETYGVPIFNEAGKVTGYLGMDRDITARKQVDEQRHFYEHIISATQDLMSFIDEHYVYQAINDSYCRYHNLKKEDIVGKSAAQLMGAEVFEQVVKENLDHALGGEIIHYEAWFDYPGIGRRYMDVTYNPFFDINQVIKGVVVVIRDHTERKKSEDKLQLKEQFQEKLLNGMLTFVAVLEPNGEVIFVNNTPLEMGGLELKDVRGKKFFDAPWWTHSDEVQNMIIRDIEQCASGESLIHDIQMQIKGGSLIWLEFSMHPIFDDQGEVEYLVPEGRDISERKNLEIGLAESEAQFRRLVEKSPAILYRYSNQRGSIYCSPRVEEILGYTPEYLLDHSNLWHDSIHPDDLPGVDDVIADLFHGKGFDIEYRIRDAQGEWHWFHDRNIDIRLEGKEAIVEGLASDITERKQTANLLQKHHDQLSQISDIQQIFLISSRDTVYQDILKHILENIGCTYGYLGFINEAGDLVCPTMIPDIRGKCQIPEKKFLFPKEKWAGIWGKSLIEKRSIYKNHSLTLPADHVHLKNAMAIPILYKNELIGQVVLANRKEDFTDKNLKKAEEIISQIAPMLQAYLNEEKQKEKQLQVELLLRKDKEEWEKTFNAMSDIVTIQDKDMHIVRANKAAHDYFEVDYGDLVGKYCYEVFSGISEPCPGCPQLKTLETLRCHSETIQHEKLGKIFRVSLAPILGENNEIDLLVHIAEDITKQKQLEEELIQSHKMEAIGTLAGGIAHDFNNILSAIIGFSKLAKQDLPEDSSAENDIDEVIRSSCRAADLVQQILTFSRKSEHDLQPLNPHLIVKEVLRMLSSSLPSTVIIHEDIDKRCGKILADPTNIHQIMMNLCTNALHAMEKETGTLTVRLYHREINAEEIEHESGVSAGLFVVLSVSDTGHGMDEATKERIFEPYYTTKETGKGTGMGLAVIHGIVKDYKGFIKVDSTLAEGSTFSVYIPALQEETSTHEDTAHKKSENKTTMPTGNERIIVVDDELLLVKIHEKQLERLGYTVTGTTDSRDALEKIRAQPEQFDLLITDQTMPGLSGVELAKEVQKIRPGLPIILCTGHSDVVSKEEALAMGIKKYVSKPIYRDELFLAIREVLDEK